MTTGEKIKYFRNMRGISQETLGQLSGINSATIKKYEYGIRNPKPDQLLKIANALGISINIFMDFDIETVSDVLSLLLSLIHIYSIGLLSNNLCSFASDCSVVLRAASTSSHFIRNIFPSVKDVYKRQS